MDEALDEMFEALDALGFAKCALRARKFIDALSYIEQAVEHLRDACEYLEL